MHVHRQIIFCWIDNLWFLGSWNMIWSKVSPSPSSKWAPIILRWQKPGKPIPSPPHWLQLTLSGLYFSRSGGECRDVCKELGCVDGHKNHLVVPIKWPFPHERSLVYSWGFLDTCDYHVIKIQEPSGYRKPPMEGGFSTSSYNVHDPH